ncbi:MAG: hypothetical protein SPJ27_07740 [Candidatus Onthovivens sp.]|nr:hypothetical protein [Candidatus Onthovivens sp.]
MLNSSSLLFENLMKYNDATQAKRNLKENVKPVKEEDETIINLQVELPQDLEDVKPDDVKVDVGVMPVETDDVESNEDEEKIDDFDETPEEDEDVKPESDENDESKEDDKKESVDVETAKKNILNRVKNKTENKNSECTGKEDCECEACKSKKPIKNESLARLDTTSLNHLITTFVKDNYKNIDKIVISKAILENNQLILKGTITNLDGKSESIKLVNKGFNVKKLEGKKFVMDFADASNTFGIVNESVKKPFVFIASLKEGILKFNSLKYNFKTKITEGKIAKVYGTCNLLKESKTHKYNRSTFLKEAVLKPMTKEDSFGWQGANNFADGTQPYIADGKGGTIIVSGSDENDGSALISIYYGPDDDQWAWKSYDSKETALKDAKLLVNIVDDKEVDVNQLKRFGFELM